MHPTSLLLLLIPCLCAPPSPEFGFLPDSPRYADSVPSSGSVYSQSSHPRQKGPAKDDFAHLNRHQNGNQYDNRYEDDEDEEDDDDDEDDGFGGGVGFTKTDTDCCEFDDANENENENSFADDEYDNVDNIDDIDDIEDDNHDHQDADSRTDNSEDNSSSGEDFLGFRRYDDDEWSENDNQDFQRQSSRQSRQSSSNQKSSNEDDSTPHPLSSLGYSPAEIPLIKPSVASIIKSRSLTRPKSGVPKEWLINTNDHDDDDQGDCIDAISPRSRPSPPSGLLKKSPSKRLKKLALTSLIFSIITSSTLGFIKTTTGDDNEYNIPIPRALRSGSQHRKRLRYLIKSPVSMLKRRSLVAKYFRRSGDNGGDSRLSSSIGLDDTACSTISPPQTQTQSIQDMSKNVAPRVAINERSSKVLEEGWIDRVVGRVLGGGRGRGF